MVNPIPARAAGGIKTVPPKQCLYGIGGDGKLELKRQYDVDSGNLQQFWTGMVTLS